MLLGEAAHRGLVGDVLRLNKGGRCSVLLYFRQKIYT